MKILLLCLALSSAAWPADEIDAPEMVVRARREAPEPSETDLSVDEMRHIPGTGGDALRSVQSLPGVLSANDFSGELAIRGGGPQDNRYLLDSIPWPLPFHFGGTLSTVHSSLLRSVDMLASGFGARWGNALGSVLEARTRPGRKDRWGGETDVNLVGAQAFSEGPLGLGDASLTLAARRSYFELILPSLVDLQFTALPRYWDLGATLDFNLGPHDHFRFLNLASDDLLSLDLTPLVSDPSFAGEYRYHDGFYVTGINWTHEAAGGWTFTTVPYYYRVDYETSFGAGYNINFLPQVTGLKEEAVWKAGSFMNLDHELTLGGQAEYKEDLAYGYFFRQITYTDAGGFGAATLDNPANSRAQSFTLGRSVWVQDKVSTGPAALTLGLRHDRDPRVAQDALDPRVGLEWQAGRDTVVRAAWGLYTQFPSVDQLDNYLGNSSLGPAHAEHLVLGLEQMLDPHTLARVEVYRRAMWDLPYQPAGGSMTYANSGLGSARGVEFFLRRQAGRKFFGWVSYAWSQAERKDEPGKDWRLYEYDQPHVATVLGSYRFTPAWNLSLKFRINSGPLYTPLAGRVNSGGIWYPVWGSPYSARLADYARLDFRTEYQWRFKTWNLGTYFEVLNVLHRQNPAWIDYNDDYSVSRQVNNLPFLPYIGFNADF